MAQQAPAYMVPPGPTAVMAQQYVVTIQNTNTAAGQLNASPMKVKTIRVSGQIQLCCGAASVILGIVGIQLTCDGYMTGMPIWGGLAFYIVAGVLGLIGAHKKSKCIIIAYMVLSIISSIIAVQQVFMSITYAAAWGLEQGAGCSPLVNAIAAAVGLMEIIASIVGASYCLKIVCCGQHSTTMVQYVPAIPVGVPQPGMLQSQSVYSPVTCPAGPGEGTLVVDLPAPQTTMPAEPPPYSAEGGELPTKQVPTGPYYSTTGVDGDTPAAQNELLLS